jgi:hypothetical protein
MNKHHTYHEEIETPGYKRVQIWCRTGSSLTEGFHWAIFPVRAPLSRSLPNNDEYCDSDFSPIKENWLPYDE